MRRRAWVICILLALVAGAGRAQSGEDKLVREYAKTLATDKDAEDRVKAAHWLGGRKSPEAVAALAKALSDPDASVRQAAASALWDTGKDAVAAKPELEKALHDFNAAVVARAAGALAVMGVPDAELADAWRRALAGSHDAATAFLAARGLIGIDPAETLAPPILAYLAKNAREAERGTPGRSNLGERDSAEAATRALERLLKKNPAPLLPLLEQTARETPESAHYVLAALGTVRPLPPGTVELALGFFHAREPGTRSEALALAGRLTSERETTRWIPEAIPLLSDPDESVRKEACRVLKGVKGLAFQAAPELARLVSSDPSVEVRVSAASALGEIGDASNPVPRASRLAVASAARGALAAAMKDKDHDLAVEAVAAYNVLDIDSAAVVATLADAAVSGADPGARARALQCLRNRQGQAKSALEAIRPLAQSPDKTIADEARAAIEWIERGGGGSPGPIKGGPSSEAAAAKPSSAKPAAASEAPPGGEEKGMAVLRARHLEYNETGFYRALSEADTEAISAYLDAGMSARHVFADANRRSPLMVLFFHGEACAKGDVGREIVVLLLKRGADVNQEDEKKNTALMFAADKCDRETLRLLLKAGASVNAKNFAGLTALQMGIVSGNPGLEELIAAGARLDAATAKAYADAYKGNPKALSLIRKATAK